MGLPHGTVGRGTQVAVVHMAFLALSFAGCDVQDPCPCAHGMAGTCNTLDTRILPVWLIAACSSLLGKGSLALAAQQSLAGTKSPGTVLAQGGVWQALPCTQVGLNGLLAPREL